MKTQRYVFSRSNKDIKLTRMSSSDILKTMLSIIRYIYFEFIILDFFLNEISKSQINNKAFCFRTIFRYN